VHLFQLGHSGFGTKQFLTNYSEGSAWRTANQFLPDRRALLKSCKDGLPIDLAVASGRILFYRVVCQPSSFPYNPYATSIEENPARF
jgi:hypothetical protein